MSARRYLSPLRYPGGKARMAPALSDVFAHQISTMDVEVWLEPFAGAAGAALRLLEEDAVSEAWLTEKNPALAALWRTLLHNNDELAARVQATTPDMNLWGWARELITATAHHTGPGDLDLDLAFAALVMNRCSRSGIIHPNAGPMGGTNQAGAWTLTSRWNSDNLADRIRHLATLAPRLRFTEGDAITAIADLAGSGIEDEVVAFIDPPYIREGNRLYAHGMSATDHRALADTLNASPVRWLLTYDDEPSVAHDLYPHRRVISYEIPNTANKARIATEYAVLSDNLHVPEPLELLPGAAHTWIRPAHAAAH